MIDVRRKINDSEDAMRSWMRCDRGCDGRVGGAGAGWGGAAGRRGVLPPVKLSRTYENPRERVSTTAVVVFERADSGADRAGSVGEY